MRRATRAIAAREIRRTTLIDEDRQYSFAGPHDAAASYMGCWQPEFRTNELQDDKP